MDLFSQAPPITFGMVFRVEASTGFSGSQWNDLSTNANHLVTGAGSIGNVNPVQVTVNGKLAIRFNGTNVMQSSSTNNTVDSLNGTIFVVKSSASNGAEVDVCNNLATVNEMLLLGDEAYHQSSPGQYRGKNHHCSTSVPVPGLRVNAGVFRPGATLADFDYYLNGIKSTSVTCAYGAGGSPTPYTVANRRIYVGSRIQGGGLWNPFTGDIYEVIVYRRELSQAEVVAVSNHLKTKYGINYSTCGSLNVLVASLDSNLCLGENLILQNLSTASIGATYTWNFGLNATPATFNGKIPPAVSYSSAGNYTVKLKIVDGLETDSTEYHVHVGTVIANAGRDTSLCSDTLIYPLGTAASSNCTYLWTPSVGLSNATISNPILNTNSSRTYILKVTDTLFNCVKFDTIQITLNFIKKLKFEIADTTVCFGDQAQFSYPDLIVGSPVFNWNFGPAANPPTYIGFTPPQVLFTDTGFFNVQLKRQSTCGTDSITRQIYIVPKVQVNAGRDTTLCADSLIYQLGAASNPNFTYQWNPVTDLSNPTIANPILNTNSSRTYVLKVTNTLFNCVKSDTIQIALNFIKKLKFEIADTTVCFGDQAQFSYPDLIVGSPVFNWNFGPAANPPTYIGFTPPQVLFTDTGFFNVQLKRQSTCGLDSITRQIYIVPKVQVNAGRDTTLCADSLIYQLGAASNPNFTYQWNPVTDLSNPTIANPILNTKNSNQYIITSTNQIFGCFTKDTVNISISNKGNFKMNIVDSTLCITTLGQFSCTGNLLPGVILNWTFGIGASIASYTGTNPPLVTFSDTGIHWIKLVKRDFCSTDSITRSVKVAPIPSAYAGSDTNLCTDLLIRNLGEQSIPGYTYTWTPTTGLSNSNISNPVLNTTKSATYVLTVLNSEFECSNTDAVQFVVNPLPRLRIEGDSILCDGQSRVLKAISNYPVRWNGGNIGDTILVNSKSMNKVKTASVFCIDIEDSIFVNQYDKPFLFFDSVIIAKKEESKNIELNTNGLNIKWNPLMDLLCTDCKSQVVKVKSNMTYFITASIGECSITKPLEIKLKEDVCDKIGVPTGFSPNGDGVNDLFRIKYPCRFNYFEIQIYNRWGELVFESKDPEFNWDGTFKGTPQPLGIFVYNLSFSFQGSSMKTRNGNLTLIR